MSKYSYVRSQATELMRRLQERRRFLQVITGARQVGKTTLVTQVAALAELPYHFASADEPTLRGPGWLEAQWEAARLMAGQAGLRCSPDGLCVARKTLENFVARAVRLYEQEPGELFDSSALWPHG